MADLREVKKHNELIEICGKCGDCSTSGTQITTAKRHVDKPCPVKNVLGFEAYDARGRILILKNLLNEKLKIDDSILEWAYSCTQCGSCKETCLAIEGGIDTPLLMQCLRNDLVREGFKLEKHEKILNSILVNRNPYEEPSSERFSFLKNVSEREHIPYWSFVESLDKTFDSDSEILLYLGCTSSYREQELALSAIQLLDNLGVKFAKMENENCCGSILKRYGYMEEFKELAISNLKDIKEKNVKQVIFPCAGCYRTYKVDYKDFNNTSIQFYHIAEFLEEHLKTNSFNFKFDSHKKITYHDPCHLGRHCGVYEAPRTLLKNIQNSTFVEFDALRNYSHCCGAGGGVKSTRPELAIKIAKNRIQDGLDKSVEIIVSACPFCEKNLKDCLTEDLNTIEILDITEVLSRTLKKEMTSRIVAEDKAIKSQIGKHYMDFLAKYPEIFSDLVPDSILDFAIYSTYEDLESESEPSFAFNVLRTPEGIDIKSGKADEPDLELALAVTAVEKLKQNITKENYAKQFGLFYNEPNEEDGWIDFVLHKRTKTLIKMGYGKFAEAAGILEDEDEID